MSHLEKILDETFGKEKPKQVEVAVERLHPPMAPKEYIASLNDPKAFEGINLGEVSRPRKHEPIVSEKVRNGEKLRENALRESTLIMPLGPKSGDDSKLAIGSLRYRLKWDDLDPTYQEWCLASETYRHYIFTVEGKTSRKTGIEAMDKIGELREERQMIREIKKIDPNVRNMGSVINEYKAKVAKIQEKRVE